MRTSRRRQKNAAQIKAIGTSAQAVLQTAQQANQTAKAAVGLAKMVESRTEAIENSRRRLVYETVLSADDATFGFEETELSEAAKKELTALVERLKQETRNVLIVVEGHTDSTGPRSVNEKIGVDRAWVVEKYLYEEHHVPLTKIDVISHGEERPVPPNTTREGRAQNRRGDQGDDVPGRAFRRSAVRGTFGASWRSSRQDEQWISTVCEMKIRTWDRC